MAQIDPEVEQKYYAQLYGIADADRDNKIAGPEGALFLRRSGLEDKLLERIWDLVDSKKRGFLEQREFAVAMRLISLAQSGFEVDLNKIHDVSVLPSFRDIPVPVTFNSVMTDQDLYKYDNLFGQADLNQDNFVDGLEAKTYFEKSKLSKEILAKIWVLSELDGDARLNKAEFRLAMHLVYESLKNHPLPKELPANLISRAYENLGHPNQSSGQGMLPKSSSFPLPQNQNQPQYQSQPQFSQVPSQNQFTPAQPIFSSYNPDSQNSFAQSQGQVKSESHLVAQYALGSNASFETRAGFNSELNSALKARTGSKPKPLNQP